MCHTCINDYVSVFLLWLSSCPYRCRCLSLSRSGIVSRLHRTTPPPLIPLALVDVAIIGGMEPGKEYYSAQAVLTISDCYYNYCTPLTSIWSVTVCIAFGGSSGCKISWRTITLDLCRIESFYLSSQITCSYSMSVSRSVYARSCPPCVGD